MIQAWRICGEAFSSIAFSGEGARLYGGRWNSRGISIVYAASSRSLAMLETLVHIRPEVPYVFIPAEFDESLVERISVQQLDPLWSAEPPTLASQALGNEWIESGSSAVLAVPSAIVPEEYNYLLNPNHRRFTEIKIGKPSPCRFDPRPYPY